MQQSYFNTDAFTNDKSKQDHQQEDWLENYKLFFFFLSIYCLFQSFSFKTNAHTPQIKIFTSGGNSSNTASVHMRHRNQQQMKVPCCRYKLAMILIESVWAKMSNSAPIDLYCTEKCARPSPNPHWRGALKRILSGTETSFPSSIMLRAWHPCAAQHALYPEHRSKPLSKSGVMMRSIKMSYCCHCKGEPLRTDGGPWIIAPTLTFLWRDQAQAYFHKGAGSLF